MKFQRYKADLDRLLKKGHELLLSMLIDVYPEAEERIKKEGKEALPKFDKEYQLWYSEALSCLQQLLPSRVDDFLSYYKPTKVRKNLDVENYTISDYLRGLQANSGAKVIVGRSAALKPFEQQVKIVESLKQRFESTLFDIRALVQADMFDDELDAADDLNKKGYQRGAGAIAGVVLEGHLATVCQNHKIPIPKSSAIAKLNDSLKDVGIIDQATWRFIQHLGDLRNLSDHKKDTEPTPEQIRELIAGTRKIMKTVF